MGNTFSHTDYELMKKMMAKVDNILQTTEPLFYSIGAVIDAVDKIPPARNKKAFAFKFIVLIVLMYYSCYPLLTELIGPCITETTKILTMYVHTFLMYMVTSVFSL